MSLSRRDIFIGLAAFAVGLMLAIVVNGLPRSNRYRHYDNGAGRILLFDETTGAVYSWNDGHDGNEFRLLVKAPADGVLPAKGSQE